jgi:hypothetical protein
MGNKAFDADHDFISHAGKYRHMRTASSGISAKQKKTPRKSVVFLTWRPQGDSNPCTHRERVMS